MISLLTLAIFCLISTSGYAYKEANGVVLNGKELALDVKPIIKEGRTLVPARALLEALGLKVTWNSNSRTVVGENKYHRIELEVDNAYGYNNKYNNMEIDMDVSPIVIKQRTLIPVRMTAELLGLDVSWNSKTSKVIIKTKDEKPEISLEDAYNILRKHVDDSSESEYVYAPFSSYASGYESVIENFYIYHVEARDNFNETLYTADFNYCVNKYTGYIYEFQPDGEFYYSDKNPYGPPSEEFRYPEYNER